MDGFFQELEKDLRPVQNDSASFHGQIPKYYILNKELIRL